MLTPQQIQEVSFEKAIFGGYDMDSVDDFLEPLTEDYIALYKENSVLKSKMRILVEKLEEYRRQESSMQNAILAAQKTCEQMTAEAEKKCAKLLRDAEQAAEQKAQNADVLIGEEKERLDAAQAATAQFLDGMEKRLKRQLELMDELRRRELPKKAEKPEKPEEHARRAFDFDKAPSAPTAQEKADALIEEIGASIEEHMAQPEPPAAPVEIPSPKDDATRRLEELHLPPEKQKIFEDLQFGRNYDPRK